MAVSELVRPKRGSQTQSPRDKKQRKKLVGAELVGSRVKKWFETKYYNGTVTAFDEEHKWYKVMYDDGDKEEMNLKELREVLDEVVGLSKENAITTPNKNTPKKGTPRKDTPKRDKPLVGKELIGAKVTKQFNYRLYNGTVAAYDEELKWYKVDYDDGDKEEMNLKELRTHLTELPPTSPRVLNKKADVTTPKKGKPDVTTPKKGKPATLPTPKKGKPDATTPKKGKPMVRKEVPTSPPVQDEADSTTHKKSKPRIGKELIGAKVKKQFNYRFYTGTVTEFDEEHKWYKVMYDDGDKEEMNLKEIRKHLTELPPSSPPAHTIGFDDYISVFWALVAATWVAMCDEHKVPSANPARLHLYRPGEIMKGVAQPKSWQEGDEPIEERQFTREQAVEDAQFFTAQFLGSILNVDWFQPKGAEHVLRWSEWPTGWSQRRKEEYAKAFAKLFEEFNDLDNGYEGWSLLPHLWDKETNIVERVVDKTGLFPERR